LYKRLIFVPIACLWTHLVYHHGQLFKLGHAVFLLRRGQYPAENCKWLITMSNHWAQLFREVSMYILNSVE
jgi:hypothetical protein